MSKEYFPNSFTFARFCCTVAASLPEIDPQAIALYLADVAYPPYNYESARYWTRQIESLLIKKGMI